MHGDHCLVDAVDCLQRRLDLARLDSMPANLDLIVRAAEEPQPVVPLDGNHIARAVHPTAGRTERVGHEPCGRRCRGTEVPPRQSRPARVQLASRAVGDGTQPGIENAGRTAIDGCADGRARGCGHMGDQRVDGGFGWAVEIDGTNIRRTQRGPQRVGDGFAAETNCGGTMPRVGEQPCREGAFEYRGRELDEIEPMVGDDLDQQLGVAHRVLVDQVDSVSAEHPQQRLPGCVESHRPGVRNADVISAGGCGDGFVQGTSVAGEQGGESPVSDAHALRFSGRSRGEDHVQRRIR